MPKSKFLNKQKKYFETYFESYHFEDNEALRIEYSTLIEFIGGPEKLNGKNVLDLGCGTGRHSMQIAKFAKKVKGIDLSENAINIANRRAKELEIDNFKAFVSDFKNIDKEKYDIIIAINMLHHTDDINEILRNIHDSLSNNGSLIIFENNPLNLLFLPYFISIGQLRSHLNTKYINSNIFSLKRKLYKNAFLINKIQKYAFLPTLLYNYSYSFKHINDVLNGIPFVKAFSAFHLIDATPKYKI